MLDYLIGGHVTNLKMLGWVLMQTSVSKFITVRIDFY